MGPLGFLTGVVLGSAGSIVTVLAMILIVYLLISADHPAVLEEYAGLTRALLLFGSLTIVSAVAFLGLQRHTRWRWVAQGAMWFALLGVGWLYWP
jgi:hypothetical protein